MKCIVIYRNNITCILSHHTQIHVLNHSHLGHCWMRHVPQYPWQHTHPKQKKKSMSLRHYMLLKLRVFNAHHRLESKLFLKMKRWGLYFSALLYASLIYKPVPLTGKQGELINSGWGGERKE